jgi:hypothetical protein
LKVFSDFLEKDRAEGRPLPGRVLDAGCGAGVLGVCAAGALSGAAGIPVTVKAQDRDELARIFTEYNVRRNGLSCQFEARTEPLLLGLGLGPHDTPWDCILTNIPAKAGRAVLEDFVRRSASLLSPGGRVFMVAVHTLEPFFRSLIEEHGTLVYAGRGTGHTVFVYTAGKSPALPPPPPGDFLAAHPWYIRGSGEYALEDTPYFLDTIHGAAGFDSPGGAVRAAAKLAVKTAKETGPRAGGPLLFWEDQQGHFAAWFSRRFAPAARAAWVHAGRNVLSLEAACHNAVRNGAEKAVPISAADMLLDSGRIAGAAGSYSFIAAFPEWIPQTGRIEAFWEGLGALAAPGAVIIAGFSSAEAESFDRKKTVRFSRLGGIRKNGFRALAYKA